MLKLDDYKWPARVLELQTNFIHTQEPLMSVAVLKLIKKISYYSSYFGSYFRNPLDHFLQEMFLCLLNTALQIALPLAQINYLKLHPDHTGSKKAVYHAHE